MNFKLITAVLLACSSALLSGFGDAISLLPNSGNLDALLMPVLGKWGWYLLDLVLPFVSVVSVYYVAKVAYAEGLKA